MSIFFAAGARVLRGWGDAPFPAAPTRPYVRSALRRRSTARSRAGSWASFVAMLTVGTAVGLGLWLLGVPFALGLGFVAFLLEFIPTIGPWLAGVPAVLVATVAGF